MSTKFFRKGCVEGIPISSRRPTCIAVLLILGILTGTGVADIGAEGTWRGTWTSTDGTTDSFNMDLRAGGALSGSWEQPLEPWLSGTATLNVAGSHTYNAATHQLGISAAGMTYRVQGYDVYCVVNMPGTVTGSSASGSYSVAIRAYQNGYLVFSDNDTGTWQASLPPSKPINPSPSNAATNQSTNIDLSWSDGGGATSYNVYFGTDSTPDSGEYRGNQSGTSYNPGALAYATTYYWRIDARNSAGTTRGDIWPFTTETAGSSTVPQSIPYSQSFSSGRPGSSDGWEYYSTNEGRIRVISGQLFMDDTSGNSIYSLNEAILHLDLDGRNGVTLTLDHVNSGDENHGLSSNFRGHSNGDGISISADGTNWRRLTYLASSFTGQEFDLDAAIQSAGISYTSDFRIKFQQYDNYPYPSDGRFLDNIVVNATAPMTTIYVDGTSGSDSSGTGAQISPYRTVGKAHQVASNGDKIIIVAGSYPENLTMNKAVTVEAQSGLVTIGNTGTLATVVEITINGPTQVNESSGAQYTCTAHYSDGNTQIVTSSADWSDNSSYATISSSGYLTTSAVTSARSCRITATYGGRTDTHDVTIQNVAAQLSSITISGPTQIDESSGAQYTCTAHYSDGNTQIVTTSADWSENSSYATISSSGYLTTSAVTSDRSCTITASYGGETDTHSVTIRNVTSSVLVLTGPSSANGPFELTLTYTWPGGLAGSQDHYSLEYSTTSESSGFQPPDDYYVRTSPLTLTMTPEAGDFGKTFYFRARAYSSTSGWSDYSDVLSVNIIVSLPPTLRLVNNTHYYMVDIQFNGVQQISYPSTIYPSGGYYDFAFTSPASVDYTVGVGFYDTYWPYTPNVWWTYTGDTTVYNGQTSTVTCDNPTVSQLMCNWQTQRKFGGHYLDSNATMYWCYFVFYSGGSWQLYSDSSMGYTDGTLVASGTVREVSWPDYAMFVKFNLGDGRDDISINYASGFSSFFHRNGPASWPIIEYTGQ